jgi:hypothetical protein
MKTPKTPLECIIERDNPKMIGSYVSLKTRMSAGDAHYAGELVEGAHIVTAWGDVGTELAIRLFGDESLFVGYSEVRYIKIINLAQAKINLNYKSRKFYDNSRKAAWNL